jgi:lysophospholipase
MRRGVVFASLLLLAACGHGDHDAFLQSRLPPGLAERFYPPEGWAWGEIRLGDAPPQRYGVSAPGNAPRAQILILPDYGESAETWFETARDLNAAGFTVWVLEGAGQGGSGRRQGPRDLGHVVSFDPDVAAVRAMLRTVLRPTGATPTVLLGHGVGAVIAARAVQRGIECDGLILSAFPSGPFPAGDAPLLRTVGLGGVRAGPGGWRSDAAAASSDPWRGRVTHLWQAANPELRMGGPSLDWAAAFDGALTDARRRFPTIDAPLLVIEGDKPLGCRAAPHCAAVSIPHAERAMELAPDAQRGPWLAAIVGFVRQRLAAQASVLPNAAPPL